MNIKEIATTLAILGTGSLAVIGCGKEKAPATEVPAGGDAVATDAGEASCAEGHQAEGHCNGGGETPEAGAEGEASCSGEAAGGGEAEGEAACSGK